MSTLVKDVVEFNREILRIDQRKMDMLAQHEFEISMACLQEEVDEFQEAFAKGDFVGCIDAMIDLRYFAIGVMYKMGLSADTIGKCDAAVHAANMEKKLGVVAKRAVDGAADAVKPADWVSPELRIIEILDASEKS